MINIKKGELPDFEFQLALKKPIPVKCFQMKEPFSVETMEGILEGKAGDYLMVGIKGEMYPCDKAIFEESYEIVS